MRITDYSVLPVGLSLDGGEIKVCPHCGKNGLAEEVNKSMFFTHRQEVGWNENNQPVMTWEMCPRQEVKK